MDLFPALMLAFVLAILPAILYALIIWWLDRHEKEPFPLLLVAFLWGAIPAILLALGIEVVAHNQLQNVISAAGPERFAEMGIVAPIVEEAVKAIVLVALFLIFKREFDNVLDGIVYGALVGLGFSVVENVLYLASAATQGGTNDMIHLWLLRSGLFGLNHSMFTAITGAALGYARSISYGWQRGLLGGLGLGGAMVMHAIHNSLISVISTSPDAQANESLALGICLGAMLSDFGGILVILIVAIISGVRETRIIRETLWEEVLLGRLSRDEYDMLALSGRRWSARWSTLFHSGFHRWRQLGKFFDLTSELAFRKHRLHDGSAKDQEVSARDVARLRYEIDNLKMAMAYGI